MYGMDTNTVVRSLHSARSRMAKAAEATAVAAETAETTAMAAPDSSAAESV